MFYDGLSRLLSASYNGGAVEYTYGYDAAGNLVNNNGVTRTYNAANQMVNDGTNTLTYDGNGNLTSDGVNSLTWDRANRMLTAPGSTSYKYDGLGNRIQQTVSSVVTDYLNDVQPGLVKLLRQTEGVNVDHFVHAVRGIHAVDDGTDWTWYMQDGLGSVRGLVDDAAVVQTTHQYDPYGNYIGTAPTDAYFGFTGEQTQGNGQVYLRARYYNPDMATFTALDPYEGRTCTPMSLNGYSWVEGNPVINVDPSGMIPCSLCNLVLCGDIEMFRACQSTCQGWVSPVEGIPEYRGGYKYANLCFESETRLSSGFLTVFYECNGLRTSREAWKRLSIYRENAPSEGCQCEEAIGKTRSIYHPTVDISTTENRINAVGSGKVVGATERNDYGKHIFIDHGYGIFTFYAHLSDIKVSEGDSVEPGQQIGISGKTGTGSGNTDHLHFEVRTSTIGTQFLVYPRSLQDLNRRFRNPSILTPEK